MMLRFVHLGNICLFVYLFLTLGIDDGIRRIVILDVSELNKIKQRIGVRFHSIFNLRVNQIRPFWIKFLSFLLY
jgi:hypothetical protein